MTDSLLGFVFNGVSSLTYGVALEEPGVDIPLRPPVRERLVTIPTMDGQWDYGSYDNSLPIMLDCFIVNQAGRTALVTAARGMAAVLDPHVGAKPLIVPERSGFYLARYTGTTQFLPLINSVHFKLPFIATDPVLHSF